MRSAFLTLALLLLAPSSYAGEPKKDDKKEDTKKDDKADPSDKKEAEKAASPTIEPPHETWDHTDVEELAGKRYMFVGLRYRGAIIPKFVLGLFVDEGKTIYSNTIGVEFDWRKDGFSLVPALSYTEYGFDDVLFKEKNSKDIPGDYTVVNSSMKSIYATVDLLWSSKISKNVDFEYGVGLGLAAVFGRLGNNWVYEDAKGSISNDAGKKFSKCATAASGAGCTKSDHQGADTEKVGDYSEPSWFDGGAKPVLFPWVAPQLGLRFKPFKEFQARLNLGLSLTGIWFGLGADYGLEQKPAP